MIATWDRLERHRARDQPADAFRSARRNQEPEGCQQGTIAVLFQGEHPSLLFHGHKLLAKGSRHSCKSEPDNEDHTDSAQIIDRIIAQEGFEHVLSVDYKTRRGKASTSNAPSTGATSGMGTSGKPRGSVQDLVHNMHAQSTDPATDQNGGDDFLQTHSRARPASAATATAPSLAAFEIGGAVPTPVVTPPTPAKEPRKARPLSLMVRGWSYAGDSANTAATTKTTEQGKERDVPSRHASVSPEKAQPNDEEVKAEKRAKRGFSIDFRSFGFGSGSSSASSSAPAEPKGLKPLTLPRRQASGTYTASNGSASGERSRATSPIAPSPLEASGSVPGQARKLPQMEEDEEDKRERHRMEAAMRLMGINRGVSFNGGPASPIGRGDYDTSNNQAHVLSSPVGLSLNSNPDSPVFPSDDRLPSPDKDRTRAPLTGTPLSRLHTALTSTSNSRTSSPMLELADPLSPVTDRAAEEALRAFDGGEAEQAKMLAQGRAMTEFTTPRKVGEGRRRMSGRRGPSAYGQG